MMKRITHIFTLAFMLLAGQTFAQEFYPLNLFSLATVKTVGSKVAIQAKEAYLYEKGFTAENDSLFVNKKTGEQVRISATQNQNKVEIKIIYYTIATDLTRFMKRASDSGLPKVSENLFEKKFPTVTYSLDIKRNVSFEGKKFNELGIHVSCEQNVVAKVGAMAFGKIDDAYPLQNSTWYFDVALTDDRKDKDQYFVSIALTEDKKFINKIVFIDDETFRVTLADNQVFTGTYTNGGYNDDRSTSISFRLTKPKTPKSSPERLDIPGVPQDASELKKAKNTIGYFKYFFNRHYTYKIDGQRILLKSDFNENMPIVTVAPPN